MLGICAQFINSYIIVPTFVASVINSYFTANLRKLSLISEEDVSKYMEVWYVVSVHAGRHSPGHMRARADERVAQRAIACMQTTLRRIRVDCSVLQYNELTSTLTSLQEGNDGQEHRNDQNP